MKEEPNKFFMHNNGLTIISEKVVVKPLPGGKKFHFKLDGFQVLNGGQTLRTVHKLNQMHEDNIMDYLHQGEVLVRLFTGLDESSMNKIAEYTNSQNAISSVDLKSLRNEQIQLEQYLDECDILYARKTGDTGLTDGKEYKHKISMEKFGQILFSIKGNPHKATSAKKQIFDKFYDDVFGEENFNIEDSGKFIMSYYNVESIYNNSEAKSSDNKIFYILYMLNRLNKSIEDLI